MTISEPFAAIGSQKRWVNDEERGITVLNDDGSDDNDDQIALAKLFPGRKPEKSWRNGSTVRLSAGKMVQNGHEKKEIRSSSDQYEDGGSICIDDGEDDDRLVTFKVRAKRGFKRRRATGLNLRVSSAKKKIMVSNNRDEGGGTNCGEHWVSRDFSDCQLRTGGFEVGVRDGETKNRNFDLNRPLEEEAAGGCEVVVVRHCLNPLVSHVEVQVSVSGKERKKKAEENEYVAPEGTQNSEVLIEEGEVEDDDELVINEKQNALSMDGRKRYASEFAHSKVLGKRMSGENGVQWLRAGAVVWANSSSENWWPGWACKVNKSKVLVFMFGQDRFCWLRVSGVLPFEENYVEKSKNAKGKLKVAIQDALEELGRRAALGLICLCEGGVMKFSEDEKSAVVDVPGYGRSGNYAHEQIIHARNEFQPVEMLGFLQKVAVSVFIDESDTVGANRAIAQANAYRCFVAITPDWIYRETMRLTEVEYPDDSSKGRWEAEPLANTPANDELTYESGDNLMVRTAAEVAEEDIEGEEEEERGGEKENKNSFMVVEWREEVKDSVDDRPLYEKEFQSHHSCEKSNVSFGLEESYGKLSNNTHLQEEIKGIEENPEQEKSALGACATNEMDFSSLWFDDGHGLQDSGVLEHNNMDTKTNAGDEESLFYHRINIASNRATEFRVIPQDCISIETSTSSLHENLTHLHCLAVDLFYGSDSAEFVVKTFLRYRDLACLNISKLKCLGGTMDRRCEFGNRAAPKNTVAPSCVSDAVTVAIHNAKKDSIETGGIRHEREKNKSASCSSLPNSDMVSIFCQSRSNATALSLTSQECISIETKMPSLLETLAHLHCLALDPFFGADSVAFIVNAFLRHRAVTFLNITNLKSSVNRDCSSVNSVSAKASAVFQSVSDPGNGTTTNDDHAKRDSVDVITTPRERDKVKSVPISVVPDDEMLNRFSQQRTNTSFHTVNKLTLNAPDYIFVEASMPSLHETLTHLWCLALDPFYGAESVAFVCKAFLRHRAMSFLNVDNLKSLKDSFTRQRTFSSKATQGTTMVTSSSVSGPEDGTSIVYHDEKNFGVGGVPLERVEARSVSNCAVHSYDMASGFCEKSEKDHCFPPALSCKPQMTENSVSSIKHMEELSLSSNSVTTPNRQQISASSEIDLAKTAINWRPHLHMQGLGKLVVVPHDGRVKGASDEDLEGEINCKTLVKPGQTAGYSVEESGVEGGTNVISPVITASAATSSISLFYDTKYTDQPVDEVTQDDSLTVYHRDANLDGGFAIGISADQHDCDDATKKHKIQRSDVIKPLSEMYMFLCCLACNPFYGRKHLSFVKQAFLRYRVASYHKNDVFNSVEYRHGLRNNHECLVAQSPLTKGWLKGFTATDRIPDDSHKARNVTLENVTNSENQGFSSTITSPDPQTNDSRCVQSVSAINRTTSHTDLMNGRCSGNNLPQKRKLNEIPAANTLHMLKKPDGVSSPGNWYASPLTPDGAGRSVDDVKALVAEPTRSTKIEKHPSRDPESYDVGSCLHMKFPKNFELPSKDQLIRTFRRFGPVDCSKTRVFFYTGSGQVFFQRHADTEAAYKFARETVLFGQANIRFWVSKPAKLTQRVQTYNCTDSVRKPISRESGNGDQNPSIRKQQLKGYDHIDHSQSLFVSNVKSCLRKLNGHGEKDQKKSAKVTFSVDSLSCSPAENIMNKISSLTSPCNESLKKESSVYQKKMLSLLKNCEQLIDNIRGSVGLESYYELLIHELRRSFQKPDEEFVKYG